MKKITFNLAPLHPAPLDEGLTFTVSVMAKNLTDAIQKLLRYVHDATIISSTEQP